MSARIKAGERLLFSMLFCSGNVTSGMVNEIAGVVATSVGRQRGSSSGDSSGGGMVDVSGDCDGGVSAVTASQEGQGLLLRQRRSSLFPILLLHHHQQVSRRRSKVTLSFHHSLSITHSLPSTGFGDEIYTPPQSWHPHSLGLLSL